MTGPGIVIEPHPLGFRVYTLDAGDTEPPVIIILDDLEEARESAAMVANFTGFPIFDRTKEQS